MYIPVGFAVWLAMHESGVHATIAGVALGLLCPARPVRGRELLATLEHRLHPVSAFVVVPLFALANAGIDLRGGNLQDALESRVAWAIAAGLVIGKLVGITSATLLVLRRGWGDLPDGAESRHVAGVAALGGIGFTVSLFIAQLAYEGPTWSTRRRSGSSPGRSSVESWARPYCCACPGHRTVATYACRVSLLWRVFA